jgi:Ca2+-binding RTX toxin-like protein
MAIRRGTSGADAINGTAGTDWLFGRGGDDRIHGFGGEDALWGDAGDDIVWGDADADFLSGGTGDDQLGGGGTNNVLHGEDGDDTLLYNPGAIELVPGTDYGGQYMVGGRGHDTLRLGSDAYFILEDEVRIPAELFLTFSSGSAGSLLFTRDRSVFVNGGSFEGIEQFEFSTPVDVSIVGPGMSDTGMLDITGSPGNDRFVADYGTMRIAGGGGADEFNLVSDEASVVLNPGQPDRVFVSSSFDGERQVYGFGAGDTVVFRSPYDLIVSESQGSTTVTENGELQTGSLVIDAVGLVRNGDTFSFGPGTVARGAPPPPIERVPADEPPPPPDVWGTPRNDIIAGGDAEERIFAGNGNDRVMGRSGDDLIHGGGGADQLFGDEGYDRIFGGPGNDRIQFGSDGGEAHGGSGNDVLLFDPGAIDLSFSQASGRIDGGVGFDTLRVTNRAVAGWGDDPVRPAVTQIDLDGMNGGTVNEPSLAIGAFTDDSIAGAHLRLFSIERIQVTSDAARPVIYDGQNSALPSMHLISGDGNDVLSSGAIDEVLDGGRGNDSFRFGGGNDRFISRLDDADRFEVGFATGTVTIQGFNGAGTAGGDTISVTEGATVTRVGATTVFDWGPGEAVVNATGLVEGTDYFFA